MSMPHTCRCGICGNEMSPLFVIPTTSSGTGQTVGSKPVEHYQARHEIKTETYRVRHMLGFAPKTTQADAKANAQ